MEKPSGIREKLLADIEKQLAEAPDEATRQELERLRESMNSPRMLDMARDLEKSTPRQASELVLHFHAPQYPTPLTASGCVIATVICLYAAMLAFSNPLILIAG